METPFKFEDVEDVRIIIKANGKNYSIIPKEEIGKEEAKDIKLIFARIILDYFDVVVPALEDIKKEIKD